MGCFFCIHRKKQESTKKPAAYYNKVEREMICMKWIVKMMLALLLCLPVQSWAFPNEPNGFRDLYWGESLEEVKQGREVEIFKYDEQTNSVTYWVHLNSDEPKTLSQVPILGECLGTTFWNDKLWVIALFFNEEDAFSDLKFAMTQLYGEPQTNGENYCRWRGETTFIALEKDTPDEGSTCVLLMSSKILDDMTQKQVSQGW